MHALEPIFDPFHRPAHHATGMTDDDLFRIGARFRPEASTHVLGDHPDLVFRHVENSREVLTHVVVRLRRHPDRQPLPLSVIIGNDAAGLECERRLPRKSELPAHTMRRGSQRAHRVALRMAETSRHVARPFRMQLGRTFCQGLVDRREGLQWSIVDMHQRGQILRLISICRHQESNRLTHEANAIRRQELGHAVADAGMPIPNDPWLIVEGQICRREHAQSTGCKRLGGVDRCDLGVCMRAADEHAVHHSIEMHVVDKSGASREQAPVLPTQGRSRRGVHGASTSLRHSSIKTAARCRRYSALAWRSLSGCARASSAETSDAKPTRVKSCVHRA